MNGSSDTARRVAEWAGYPLNATQCEALDRYAAWLVEEAIPAGGLGPREGDRIWERHIADALSFAAAWPDEPPRELLDVGTGVGLPGIPLAVLWPDCAVTLLDRGGRRVRLLHRITGMLELATTLVEQADVFAVADSWEALAFRGSVTAPEAVGLSSKLLELGGRAVLGLSRRPEPPARAPELLALAEAMGMAAETRHVPAEVLDGGAWLLIMRS